MDDELGASWTVDRIVCRLLVCGCIFLFRFCCKFHCRFCKQLTDTTTCNRSSLFSAWLSLCSSEQGALLGLQYYFDRSQRSQSSPDIDFLLNSSFILSMHFLSCDLHPWHDATTFTLAIGPTPNYHLHNVLHSITDLSKRRSHQPRDSTYTTQAGTMQRPRILQFSQLLCFLPKQPATSTL